MKTFTRQQFIQMYQQYDAKTLAQMCECSIPTLYNRINELGIAKKGRGVGHRKRRKLMIED